MTDPTRPLELTVRADRWLAGIFVFCVSAQLLFFALDYHVNYGRLTDIGAMRRLFNTAREDGLASWFAVTQTTLLALTVWALLVCARAGGASRWRQIGWLVLAVFFSFMSADDGATIHERLGTTFKAINKGAVGSDEAPTLAARILEQFPSYSWQIAVLPFFAVMGVFLAVFLWRELRRPRARLLVILALGCYVTAIGLDFVEGLGKDHPWNPFTWLTEHTSVNEWARERFHRTGYDALRHFQKSLEECVEMFGTTLLWLAFLGHLFRVAKETRLTFRFGAPEPNEPDNGSSC
ncbi:MAG: hypothetical protein GY715_16290 [Planctomycetes bacterium]|nr:hypothetical protein [Planctomycetota bacterium]